MTAQEMERKLRSAILDWNESPSTAGWKAVLDVVYDYAGSEYEAGKEAEKLQANQDYMDGFGNR